MNSFKPVEAAGDLDISDPNASAWNRAACGLLDHPADAALTPADVLAITAAESIAAWELTRIAELGE